MDKYDQEQKKSYKICIISGIDSQSYGIGYNNGLIYKSKKDLKRFKKLTTLTNDKNKINALMMGRKTYESIGKPLKNRVNIVLSKTMKNGDGIIVKRNIYEAEKYCQNHGNIETLYIIGGVSLYKKYLETKGYNRLYLTFFTSSESKKCDTFFPRFSWEEHREIGMNVIKKEELENGEKISVKFVTLERIINNEEEKYINLLKKILKYGETRKTRNGSTKSIFGETLTFDISEKFPLLTTKKVWLKGIIYELLWFLSGKTNVKELQKNKVHIWDGNTSREYLDQRGLKDYEEGDAGPIYGFQWRHWNAEYKGCDVNYQGKGIDQLQKCIKQLKNNPTSRRIILSGWNPEQMHKMSLPPCHVLYQFYVSQNSTLSCQMYQRSADAFLGLPFNIASTALLTRILSHHCHLKPGKIKICLGDVHIYSQHFNSVNTQIQRLPFSFPTLKIICKDNESIENYKFEDFILKNYKHHGIIRAPMIA